MVIVHVRSTNDRNGNPRRAYVLLDEDGIQAVVDEGYKGAGAIPADWPVRKVAMTVGVSPREYASILGYGRTLDNLRR